MKKMTAFIVLIALTLAPLSAFAHGHGRHTGKSYAKCTRTYCSASGVHKHGKKTYAQRPCAARHNAKARR